MSSKEQTLSNDKANAKRQSPKSATKNFDILAQPQILPATLVQRAKLDSSSLSPRDILQLQRTIGNQTTRSLLTQAPRRQSLQKEEDKTDSSDFSALIVEDSVTDLSTGQMKKKEFLKQLYQAIYAVGTEEYQRTNLTVEGCPYIAYWFDRYQGKDSSHIERAVRKYVSASPTVASSEELINLAAERARKGFKEQVKNGKITEIPDDVPQQEGNGVIPEPEMIIQRKLSGFQPSQSILIPENSKGILTEKSEKSNVIQRGCVKGGAGGGAAAAGGPVTHKIRDPNWMQVANADILETSPMGDCWAIIMINGANRLLAHLPAGDVTYLNGGPAVLNNNYNPGVTQLFLVRGLANQNESAYTLNLKEQLITNNCAFTYAQLNVIPGFWMYARVDAAGNVTGHN